MSNNRLAIRWSGENDHYCGPFTYAKERYRTVSIMLGSGDDDDYPHCRLRLSAFGRTLIVRLPGFILRPWRQKVYPAWDEATIQRLGRNWYWDTHEREIGFTISDGAILWHYGRQTHSSDTTRSKCWFLPWRSWRHIRRSFFNLKGEHYVTVPTLRRKRIPGELPWHSYELERLAEDACPKVTFDFLDYDGEALQAVTHIEEREWHRGEGKWRWLSAFYRPRISRSLCIAFGGETGRRKGSWKGGTIGHSIEMQDGDENHIEAFRRYCAAHEMTFIESLAPGDGFPAEQEDEVPVAEQPLG